MIEFSAPKIVLYINGRNVAQSTVTSTHSGSHSVHPQVIFGAGSLYPLVDDHWDMQIDDFAFWDEYILAPKDVVYVMNKGKMNKANASLQIDYRFALPETFSFFED